MLFTRVAPRRKNKGLLIGSPLSSKKKDHKLFTRVAPRTESKGLPVFSIFQLEHSLLSADHLEVRGL
jgi:hypothetical protein